MKNFDCQSEVSDYKKTTEYWNDVNDYMKTVDC